jgi:hypothetical protein
MIEASLIPACNLIHYQTIHEYERYMPIWGWGNTNSKHLLPTDPGMYSNHNRTRYFGSRDEAIQLQELDEGWEEVEHWNTSAGVVVCVSDLSLLFDF